MELKDTLRNKVAIVTASGRGMGKGIAQRLLSDGARVVICARTMSYGEQTLGEFRDAGYEVRLCPLDVTNRQAIINLVEFTEAEFGRIDIVVHCAADSSFGFLPTLTDAEWDNSLTSIVKAAFWLLQCVHPVMKAGGGGSFVFISSIAGPRNVVPGAVHYCAAKAALNALVRGAALEFALDGIRVNGIEPGYTLTARLKEHVPPEFIERLEAQLPLRRLGTVREIAGLVRYLVSEDAGYCIGSNVIMDGGQCLPIPVDLLAVNKVVPPVGRFTGQRPLVSDAENDRSDLVQLDSSQATRS